jgi:disulfide bond formation protein DsbB
VTPYGITLAACGWVIAAFHSLLYVGIIPEAIKPCSAGPSCSGSDMTVLGNLPLPVLSLAAFTLIIICLLRAPWRTQE